MIITLYQFAKKLNSTKVPSGAGTDVTCTLKEPVDILNPVFLLQKSNFTIGVHNYIKWTLDNQIRYAWVDHVTFITNDILEISCKQDTLATWFSGFRNSMQFVERTSDNNYIESLISDGMYAIKNGVTVDSDATQTYDRDDGFFVIGALMPSLSHPLIKRGPVTYFILQYGELDAFCNNLLSIQGVLTDLNPIQYIVSCVYIPCNNAYYATDFNHVSNENVHIGPYALTLSYSYPKTDNPNFIGNGIYRMFRLRYTKPAHPQRSRGEYLDYAPYTQVRVCSGAFGDFDVPVNGITDDLRLECLVDVTDGGGVLTVYANADTDHQSLLVKRFSQVGCNIALAQISSASFSDAVQNASHIASAFGNLLTLNIGASINEWGAGLMGNYQAGIPAVDTKSSNGSLANISDENTWIYYIYTLISDSDNSEIGHPVMKNIQLSSIASGSFVKVRNPHAVVNGITYAEQGEIENIMTAGFFIG